MDKTPEQVLYESVDPPFRWDQITEGYHQMCKTQAQAVIAHVRPQIEREVYEKVLVIVTDYAKLTHKEWLEKYGADYTVLGAIRALAEGK